VRALFLSQTVDAVEAALAAAGASGRVAVIDWPKLGARLAERGREVLAIAGKPRSLRRVAGARLYGDIVRLPLADGALGAVVAPGVGERDDWEAVMGELSRALGGGGALVMVDRSPATELTRRALCGGLVEVEQRVAGRTVVTSGRVVAL